MKREDIILPEGVTLKDIRVKFLLNKNRKHIIGDEFDENKSVNENSVAFLTKMYKENRLVELWDMIKD